MNLSFAGLSEINVYMEDDRVWYGPILHFYLCQTAILTHQSSSLIRRVGVWVEFELYLDQPLIELVVLVQELGEAPHVGRRDIPTIPAQLKLPWRRCISCLANLLGRRNNVGSAICIILVNDQAQSIKWKQEDYVLSKTYLLYCKSQTK